MDAKKCPGCRSDGVMDDKQRQDNGVYVEYWHCEVVLCEREWMAIYDLVEVVSLDEVT